MVCLFFLAAVNKFIFHLAREEANVENAIKTFLPSPCTESLLDWVALLEPSVEATVEDLLEREPRLTSPTPETSELPGESEVSPCPEVEAVGKFDAPPAETRRKREPPVSRGEEICDKDGIENLPRPWVGNVRRGPIVSGRF